METYFALSVIALLLFCPFGQSEAKKRLLLHSDLDIIQELANVNQKLDEQQHQIVNLTKALTEKDSASQKNTMKLEEQQHQIQNLTNLLTSRDAAIESLKRTLSDQNHKDSGSTYVRWGRTTCPHNDTELVYHGYMGGSSHSTTGGGTNFLCLSADPQWNYYDESIKSDATIGGVEYEFVAQRGDGAAKYFGQNLYNDDAVCAVCKSPRNANVMIPGRMECYSGWTKEYSGYLVSNYDTAPHETEYICLDERPEAVVGGKNDDNEGLMYFVEASCGKSLECPPYVNGRELTCVVCSK